MTITGSGRRTLDAIQRMVPAHAAELDKISGWSAHAELIERGVRLIVLAEDPKSVAKIRGLGFLGLMVTGGHHQAHHLAIARGEMIHGHP